MKNINRKKRVFNPEEEFILLCIKEDKGGLKEEILRIAASVRSWDKVVELACKKGVAQLVYRSLKAYNLTNVLPESLLKGSKISYLTTLTKNNFYKEELKQLLREFMGRNIPVIPLKGISLSGRLYGDNVSRSLSVDCDLLIKEEDKDKARPLLEKLGYTLKDPKEIKKWKWYWIFNKQASKMIELHWDITMMGRSSERIEGLWASIEPIEWDGIKYYDFKPEELLLYLSAHLTNSDSFRQLKYICDINRLINKYEKEIDWNSVIKKAKKWRLLGSLYAVLKLNRDFFGFQYPEDVLGKIRLSSGKRFFIGCFANKKVMLRRGIRRKILDRFLSYIFFELIEAASPGDYIAIFKRVFFPPKEIINNRGYIRRFFNGLTRLFR